MDIKNKLCFILLIALFLMPLVTFQQTSVQAQPNNKVVSAPAISWQQEYGINSVESVSNLIQTSDGGYAFVDLGWSYQFTFRPSTVYKVDSLGNMQWKKTINFLEAAAIIQTSDKGYEISGRWSTYGTTYQYTPTIVKTDSKGNIQWVENYSIIPNLGFISANIQTSDGGFAYEQSGSIIKTDSNNKTQWEKDLTFQGGGPPLPLILSSLIETSDGALAGLGVGNMGSNQRSGTIYLIKTEAFLPLPSPTQLPIPIPTPITRVSKPVSTPEIIAISSTLAIAVVIIIVLYGKHRKTNNLNH